MQSLLKHAIIALALAAVPLAGRAQSTMRQLWAEMPDTLLPYLNRNLRQECLDFVDMGVKADVDNLVGGKTVMDTLTADYTRVTLSSAAELEMRLLPTGDTTRIVCVVKILRAPEPESSVAFFNTAWQRLDGDFGLSDMSLSKFLHRPDTMSQERYDEIVSWIDPVMTSATLGMSEPVITFALSFPLTTKDERLQLCTVARERRWLWTGERFVEQER